MVEIQQKIELAEFMQNQHKSLPYEHNQQKISAHKNQYHKMLHQ